MQDKLKHRARRNFLEFSTRSLDVFRYRQGYVELSAFGKVFPMENIQEFAKQVFLSQSFSRYIGAELVASSEDGVEIALVLQEHHKQQHGFAHGGVVSYLADNAITFAGGIALGGNALTAEFKINYVRPAIGARLIACAQARNAGKRMAVCQCEIYVTDDGQARKLCAIAQGTVVPAKETLTSASEGS